MAVGALFLAGMAIGITGNILVLSVLNAPDGLSALSGHGLKLAIGALLWMLTVAGDAAHGILIFPVLKRHGERMAIGYLGFRILDAVFLGAQALFVLLQIPIGSEFLKAAPGASASLQSLSAIFTRMNLYAYDFAMISLGAAGLILCYAFYRAKLVPRVLAVWGLVGYATILGGSIAEALGWNLHSIHALPGGLWEVFIGGWLIVKGFKGPR